jgi:hypothetical protein
MKPTWWRRRLNTRDQRGLSYDAESGWYNIVWKTDKAWSGTCRALVIQLVDGTEHSAYFQFK